MTIEIATGMPRPFADVWRGMGRRLEEDRRMSFEIKQIGVQRNDFSQLVRVDVEVQSGSKRAQISLFPEPPLATVNEAAAFARQEIQELAEAILRKPSSWK
jgi:hypothetical protein